VPAARADLARLASAIDKEIDAATPAGVHATLILGILDPRAKTLRYVRTPDITHSS
jgi:hypothetical protein